MGKRSRYNKKILQREALSKDSSREDILEDVDKRKESLISELSSSQRKFLKEINKVKEHSMPEWLWIQLHDKSLPNSASDDEVDSTVGKALREMSNEDFVKMIIPNQ